MYPHDGAQPRHRHLGDALANGAAPALKTLWLSYNKIGDEGLRHLGEAVARGAAPALEVLDLGFGIAGNPASVAAQQAVQRACKDRWLDGAFLVAHFADKKAMGFNQLGWGDEEARRLAAALEHAHAQGALKALGALNLKNNGIGDEGMRHLADALARGAAPALEWLIIRGNPASDAARQALRDARPNPNPNALPGLQIFL